jgi:type IV pilus assembly protein PilB
MASIQRLTTKRLSEVLLKKGLVKEGPLQEAVAKHDTTGEPLGEVLVRRGFVGEMDIVGTISSQFSLPFISVGQYYVQTEIMRLVPVEILEKHLFVPLDRFGDVLAVVLAGPVDQAVIEELEDTTGCSVQVYIGTPSDVRQAIERYRAAQVQSVHQSAERAPDHDAHEAEPKTPTPQPAAAK